MNRPIIISIITVCAAALCGFGIWNTDQVNTGMAEALNTAEKAALTGDLTKATEQADVIEALWSRKESVLLLYVKHNEVDEVGEKISELKYLIALGDVAEFCSKINQTRGMIEHIWISELPLPRNIL